MNILLELQALRKQLLENKKLIQDIDILNNEIKYGRFPKEHNYEGFDLTGNFNCSDCTSLTSLEGIGVRYLKQIGGKLDLPNCPIKSNVLGLLKIKDLKKVEMDNKIVEEIINRNLNSGRRLSKCKQELIEAGLQEFAKL
jgi:hypothetical protein